MAYDQNPQRRTGSKQKKTILVLRMVRVENAQGILILKDCRRILKRHAVLFQIQCGFRLIPDKFHRHLRTF
jgi:hypothetical protein